MLHFYEEMEPDMRVEGGMVRLARYLYLAYRRRSNSRFTTFYVDLDERTDLLLVSLFRSVRHYVGHYPHFRVASGALFDRRNSVVHSLPLLLPRVLHEPPRNSASYEVLDVSLQDLVFVTRHYAEWRAYTYHTFLDLSEFDYSFNFFELLAERLWSERPVFVFNRVGRELRLLGFRDMDTMLFVFYPHFASYVSNLVTKFSEGDDRIYYNPVLSDDYYWLRPPAIPPDIESFLHILKQAYLERGILGVDEALFQYVNVFTLFLVMRFFQLFILAELNAMGNCLMPYNALYSPPTIVYGKTDSEEVRRFRQMTLDYLDCQTFVVRYGKRYNMSVENFQAGQGGGLGEGARRN